MLRGRDEQRRALDQLLDDMRGGRSFALVVRGEPGVGKSALLDDVAARSSGCAVARAGGVETDRGLAYAGLARLIAGQASEHGERLPVAQRDALRQALGLADGPPPERFLVSLAALSLLSYIADEQPLVCVIDDAQWLDPESLSVLSFVARRLSAEPIGLLFGVREADAPEELEGLPVLALEGLAPYDARRLLDTVLPGGLDQQIRDRIVTETRGNPLALLELPRGLTPAELAGGFGLPETGPLSSGIERAFGRRVRTLPAETRRLLLVAAAEAAGDAAVIGGAAESLGLDPAALSPAAEAGLVELGPGVRFRHPLARAASYRGATPHERRRAHEALAAATDPLRDPDRAAWHRARAAAGPDEDVAGDLERSAARARVRGGVAAAAAFLEQATELTVEPERRGERALAAAQLKFEAGAPDAAERLLAVAGASPLDELERAHADRLTAQIAFARTRGRDTPALLSAAAERLEPLDPALARETHLEALWAAIRSGRFARDEGVVAAAQAAAPASDRDAVRAIDLLFDAVLTRLTAGYEPALPAVANALAAFRAEGFRRENIVWCWLACQLAMDIWDDRACEAFAGGLARVARDHGGLGILPFALNYSAAHQLFLGEFGVTEQLVKEAEAITAATRNEPLADFSVLLAAWRGDRETTAAIAAAMIEAGTERGEGFAVEVAEWALAVLHNGLDEPAEALAAAERAYEHDGLGFGVWVLPELVEAGARSGDRAAAVHGYEALVERTRTSTTQWARGIEAAARALITEGARAGAFHTEAIDALAGSRVIVLHTRAQLNYGEWLLRSGRAADAGGPLEAARSAFEAMGAVGFAERARRGLRAAGEPAGPRAHAPRDALTPQEAQIARLAGERRSVAEIAAELYLSPLTVDHHLRNASAKLGADAPSLTGGAT